MKYYLILLLFIPYFGISQEVPTIGEIYDFNVGEEFHYFYSEDGDCYIFTTTRFIVLDKYYSTDNDTVFYQYQKETYKSIPNGSGLDTTYYVTIVDKFYTDLNEPIEDITAIDSTTEFTYDSTAWCNNTIVKFDYCYVCNTIGTTIIYNHYGVGLGDVLSGNANSEGSWESRNLIYANKIDTGECGERDDRVLNTYSSIAQSLEIYPNPTSNYLRLTENLDLDKMLCFDQTGKLVSELNSDDEQIDVSHLPNGQYVLLLIKDQIFVSKTFTVVGH